MSWDMLSDGKNLPYTEAVIHEIHRHATISYISVNHAPMHDTTYSGYNFLRTDMITPCLYEVCYLIWITPITQLGIGTCSG